MATNTYKRLYKGQPGTSAAAIITPASGETIWVVKWDAWLPATASAAVTLTLYDTGTGDADTLEQVILNPGDKAEWEGKWLFRNADSQNMQAKASAATAIALMVYG